VIYFACFCYFQMLKPSPEIIIFIISESNLAVSQADLELKNVSTFVSFWQVGSLMPLPFFPLDSWSHSYKSYYILIFCIVEKLYIFEFMFLEFFSIALMAILKVLTFTILQRHSTPLTLILILFLILMGSLTLTGRTFLGGMWNMNIISQMNLTPISVIDTLGDSHLGPVLGWQEPCLTVPTRATQGSGIQFNIFIGLLHARISGLWFLCFNLGSFPFAGLPSFISIWWFLF